MFTLAQLVENTSRSLGSDNTHCDWTPSRPCLVQGRYKTSKLSISPFAKCRNSYVHLGTYHLYRVVSAADRRFLAQGVCCPTSILLNCSYKYIICIHSQYTWRKQYFFYERVKHFLDGQRYLYYRLDVFFALV